MVQVEEKKWLTRFDIVKVTRWEVEGESTTETICQVAAANAKLMVISPLVDQNIESDKINTIYYSIFDTHISPHRFDYGDPWEVDTLDQGKDGIKVELLIRRDELFDGYDDEGNPIRF